MPGGHEQADRTVGGGSAADADGVRRFAADLRELRYGAGNPTLRALAARTFISKSVLSAAFAGRELPTPTTTEQLVAALDGDPEPWLRRLATLRALRQPQPPIRTAERGAPPPGSSALRRRITGVVVTVAVVAVVAAAVAAWSTGIRSSDDTPPVASRDAASLLPVVPDADPMQTACREDATVRRSDSRLDGALVLTLYFSARCAAAWAEVQQRDGATASGTALTIEVYRAGDRYGSRGKPHTAADAASVRTGLLLDVTATTETCALVSVAASGDGPPVELGAPLCG